ncbi:MAG: DUF547 domain-containing protein [Planctomycetota bacterium]
MRLVTTLVLLVFAVGCGGGSVASQYRPTAALSAWSDEEWAHVLDVVVTPDGYVRWDKLRSNEAGSRDALLHYVGRIEAASPGKRPDLFITDAQKQAYYVNAYNALCMFGVMKRGYPDNIILTFPPAALFFFDRFNVGGQGITLDTLEQKKLLDRWDRDPRFHFAFNCASTSCPPLRNEPYDAGRLDEQLAEQARVTLSDDRAVRRLADGTVGLNDIFTKFYKSDFTRDEKIDLLDTLRGLAGPDSPVHDATGYTGIGYDWSRNSPPAEQPE